MTRLRRLLFFAVVLLPFLLRFVLVWTDFERLVKASPLLEDDYFYCLNIARNVTLGNGFSADGETATTGFQWLHQGVCIAATVPFDARSTVPFRIVLTFQVLVSLACAGLLYRFLRDVWSPMEAGIGVFLFAWWVPLFRYGNNGLETVFLLLLLLSLIHAFTQFLRSPASSGSWRLPALSALLVLARIDMVCAGAATALVIAFFTRRIPGEALRIRKTALLTAGGTIIALLLILGLNTAVNGHALPDSGAAVGDLARLYSGTFSAPLGILEVGRAAAAALIGDYPLAQLLRLTGLPARMVLGLTGLCVGAGLVWTVLRERKGPAGLRPALVVGGFIGVALFVFYTGYLPAYWFLGRYLFPFTFLLLMFTLPALARAVAAMRQWSRTVTLVALVACAALYVVPGLQRWEGWMFDPVTPEGPEIAPGIPLSGSQVCHNYDIARWMAVNLEPDARVAMWQGGLVAYLASQRILHLDGVVNRPARDAWKAQRLERYLRDSRAGYLIDFRSLASLAISRCDNPGAVFRPMGASGCDAGHQVVAYRILR